MDQLKNFEGLTTAIARASDYFLKQAQKQVNTTLTLRNWMIGYYLVEYEQKGEDRAKYGEGLYPKLAEKLKGAGLKSISDRTLYLFKAFYLAYPGIPQTVSAKSHLIDFKYLGVFQTVPGASDPPAGTPVDLLLSRLSFSHFIELVKCDTPLKRAFYEVQAVSNNWSVRELQRAVDSMLFERTGLSKDKEAVLEKHRKGTGLTPEDVFRDPCMLEFLKLPEKASYVETDLEQGIIDHLQSFLLEMGRGFCFEGRQKRITFDNTHYRIDLVFYHRILRCHVLIDLKMGKFSAADAGQMNVYLNYYRENEMAEGDAAPIGIILCAGKSETLVKYATAGLAQNLFVSKYLTHLPSEEDLEEVVQREQRRLP